MSAFDRLGPKEEHGHRRHYQRGCHCDACKMSNSIYQRELRRTKARGRQPLGARIPAGQTWKRIRQLLPEFGGEQELARRLGLKRPEIRYSHETIRLITALRVYELYALLQEDLDPPAPVARTGASPAQ